MFLWVSLLTGLELSQFDSVKIIVLLFVRHLQYFLIKKQDLIGKRVCCFLTNVEDDVTRTLVLSLEGFNNNFRLHIDPEMIFWCCESTENESSTLLIINELFPFKQKMPNILLCMQEKAKKRFSYHTSCLLIFYRPN